MRLAVIGDIHGNRDALEAVLADIASRAPDTIINMGDCVSGPLDAAASADLLMLHDMVTVRGNHDRQLLDRPHERMGEWDRAADLQLTDRHRAWLAALPPTTSVDEVFICHGTPQDDCAHLLEHLGPNGTSLAAPELIRERLGDVTHPVVLCGHSHIPRVVSIPNGPLIVNPGSVGLQAFRDQTPWPHVMETGSPHARYALMERRRGRWMVELIAIEYDWTSSSALAARAAWADWAHALRTGYAAGEA